METATVPRDTVAELVIAMLSDDTAALLDANRRLVDLVADLAVENAQLRRVCERELLSRIHGDATIERYQRQRKSRAS
jgi:hypothetical protein